MARGNLDWAFQYIFLISHKLWKRLVRVLILMLLLDSEYRSHSWILPALVATSPTATEAAEPLHGVYFITLGRHLILSRCFHRGNLLGGMPLHAVELTLIAHVQCESHEKWCTAWECFSKTRGQMGADSRISNNTVS